VRHIEESWFAVCAVALVGYRFDNQSRRFVDRGRFSSSKRPKIGGDP
jgi:hypothetical protein